MSEKEKKEKHLFVELRDILTELRTEFVMQLDERIKILNDKERFNELFSIGEQMILMQKLNEKDFIDKIENNRNKIEELQKKFEED